MLMACPEILMGILGVSEEEDENGERRWILKKKNPTAEEQAAFDEFVKTYEEEKESMLVFEEE